MREADIAWAAGLFEGEGWSEVTYSKTVPGAARRVRIAVGSTDRDVIAKLQKVLGGTVVARNSVRDRFPNAKPMWLWRLASMAEVDAALRAMLPWFGSRRTEQLQKLLDAIALVPPPGSSGQTHCKNGHLLTPDNLVARELGYKRCLTCQRAAEARSYAKRKALAAAAAR